MNGLVSTRDSSAEAVSYQDALIQGLAPDGGLYVPAGDRYPRVEIGRLHEARLKPYAQLATFITHDMVGDAFSLTGLNGINSKAYDPKNFPESDGSKIAPVDAIGENLYVLDLSRGETAAFKDFGLRPLRGQLAKVLAKRRERLAILGATSGDTASAAEAAFKGADDIDLFFLSPESGMAPFQKAQIGQLSGGNIHNISVRGRFDDCQDMVKAVKKDPEFADLGALNSINWGRIVAQTVYYFDAYRQVAANNMKQPVDFVVPTGNFGNALSGHIARRMGLPIRRLILATNENNVMDTFATTGVYEQQKAQETSSPSMDISKASNVERLIYEMFEGNAQATAEFMSQFESTGHADLREYGFDRKNAFKAKRIYSGSSTHTQRLHTIGEVYANSGVIIDPHTADAVTVAKRGKIEVPTICLGTASWVKFEATTKEALGFVPERPERFKDLEAQSKKGDFTVVETTDELKDYLRAHRN